MKNIVLIPARLESTRLPGKILLPLGGKSIIQRVYEQSCKAALIDAVYIATDNKQIFSTCKEFTDNIVMTDTTHTSGTDRIAQAIKEIDCQNIVNVQGDEPFIDPKLINSVVSALDSSDILVSSAMTRIKETATLRDPNAVKVVVDKEYRALYFSRSIIPHHRDEWEILMENHTLIPDALHFYKHIGIYGYQREFLLNFSRMQPSYLERIEKLEQLRVLENGYSIQMIKTEENSLGIDTIQDYKKAQQLIKERK